MLHKKKTKEKHCLGFFRSFKWNLNSAFKSWFQFISLHTHIWMIEEYQKLEAGCFDLIFILFRNAIVSKVLIRFFFLYKNCLQVRRIFFFAKQTVFCWLFALFLALFYTLQSILFIQFIYDVLKLSRLVFVCFTNCVFLFESHQRQLKAKNSCKILFTFFFRLKIYVQMVFEIFSIFFIILLNEMNKKSDGT